MEPDFLLGSSFCGPYGNFLVDFPDFDGATGSTKSKSFDSETKLEENEEDLGIDVWLMVDLWTDLNE